MYTGVLSPGAGPAVRELAGLTIAKVSVGWMDNNAYLLRCRQTGRQLLIDAADEAARLLDLAGEAGLVAVVTTHGHEDHWLALAPVLSATGARGLAHPADAGDLPVPTEAVADGDRIELGAVELEVVSLPGHTPGSIALLYRDRAEDGIPHLFTGDSLFPGGPGRTTNPTDFDSIMTNLETKIFGRLPDETWFYPGHGKDSTLGQERPAIREWRARGW